MKLNKLAQDIHQTAISKGWWDEELVHASACPHIIPKSIGDQFTNFHGEISEAWEEYRKGRGMNEVYFVDGKPEGIPIELADLFIRVLDTCAAYNIDIESAITQKMEYNMTRSYRHGGKLA